MMMKNKNLLAFISVLGAGTAVLIGCQAGRPAAPLKYMSLSFSVPVTKELTASFLGTTSNELLYRVSGPDIPPVGGDSGAFSSPVSSGSLDFSIYVPASPNEVLSVQLNDANTHQALAIGATGLNVTGSSPVTGIALELGSVIRTCYTTFFPVNGATYGFATDNESSAGLITSGAGWDIACSSPASLTYDLIDAQTGSTNSIAFMGKGNLVDFAYVPTADRFSSNSSYSKNYVENLQAPAAPTPTPIPGGGVTIITSGGIAVFTNYNLEVGDIYCVNLATIPGGHAWLQVTNAGTSITGPTFCFRTNSTLPYYAYERTAPDTANACSTLW